MGRTSRRGAHVIEFALVTPLFLVLALGIMDWGWYMFQHATIKAAVYEGCRSGAVIDPDESPAPEGVAEDEIRDRLAEINIACTGGDDRCLVDTSRSGSSPEELLLCSVEADYQSLFELVPTPDQMGAATQVLLEIQQ